MDGENRPLSEIFAQAAEVWVDAEAAAQLLEDTKSLRMAQRQAALGADIPVNRAEQIVKASPEWLEDVTNTVEARKNANQKKVRLEVIKMRFNEWMSQEANSRIEMKL